MEWKEEHLPRVTHPDKSWLRGPLRIDKVGLHYITFYHGERANAGTAYETLNEAKASALRWAINHARNEMDAIGAEHVIREPKPAKQKCQHKCYTCGEPFSHWHEEN